MKLDKIIVLLFVIGFSLLSGCQEGMYHQTEGNVADVVQRTADKRHVADKQGKPSPTLVVNQGPYVDGTPISLAKEPTWLKNKIILRGDQLPFSYYSRTVAGGGGHRILTRYQVGLDPSTKISINYSGSVKGALDLIAAKTGHVYTVNGNDVYWQAFVTKTFDIAFMPGSSDYMMGKAGGGAGGSAPAGGGGSTTASAMVDDSSASQYSSLKGTLSVWNDLSDSLKQLISPDGKVMVSQATTSVTVRDRPTNVDLVTQFIANLNNTLSKQVLVKIQVLQITLNSAYNFGLNWDAVKRTLGDNNFVLQANYGTPVSITPLVSTTTQAPLNVATGLPQIGIQNPGAATGVTALISALSQQGKISIVTEPRVVALNNQVSVIRIINQQGYIASIQTTSFSGATSASSNNSITSQITPGTLVTGVTLYILPKIMGEKVFLQVNADLSNAISIDTLSSTSGAAPATGSTAPVIQTPRLSQQTFNQRSVIGSGDTLILSGFRQISNQVGAMQLFNSQELGGKAASQSNSETIVLITPIILHGCA